VSYVAGSVAESIADILRTNRFRASQEIQMHDDIQTVLSRNNIPWEHEVGIGKAGRIDFVAGETIRVGIEVKTKGGFNSVAAQVHRYLTCEQLDALILITAKASHRPIQMLENPRQIPFHVIFTGFNAI
jgi:hypothetical protein